MSRDHRKLRAFELTDALVLSIYKATSEFPAKEQFILVSQMRRAAISSAANIVEGCARESHREYCHHLNIAFASLRELGYFIDLSRRLGYLAEPEAASLTREYDQAASTLSALLRSLRSAS